METNGYHEGYYVLVENSAPKIVHVHFHQMVGYIEFLNTVLGPDCVNVNKPQCLRYSTFLGLVVESYTLNNKTVYFTEQLFSSEEVEHFIQVYKIDNFDGIRPELANRKNLCLETLVRGRIELALSCQTFNNGRLEVSFANEGPDCLPFLFEARMFYTAPKPGNFKRVEINQLSIFFYSE